MSVRALFLFGGDKVIELTKNEDTLFGMLLKIPPGVHEIRSFLKSARLSSEQVSRVATKFAYECFYDTVESVYEGERGAQYFFCDVGLDERRHSAYLPKVTELLLEFGLNPNLVFDGENIMMLMMCVVNEYAAADTLALLLENGGNLDTEVDGLTVFDEIDCAVTLDAIEQRNRNVYDSLVHCWLVCLGYGARLKNKETPVDVFYEHNSDEVFDLRKLKKHRNYTFGLSHTPSRGSAWSLHIFDKQTMWEVARL